MTRYYSAQANSVADLIQGVFVNYAVPVRRRGAYIKRRIPAVSRAVLEAYRPQKREDQPLKLVVGDTEERDVVRDALQSLIERKILHWKNPMDSTVENRSVYNLYHRTGVPVLVIVRG